jgi:hypothetical protein
LRCVTLRSSRLTRHAQAGCALVQRRLPARRRGLPQDGAGQRTAHWQPCQCERCSAQGISHQDLAVAGGDMSIHLRALCVQINIIFTFRYTETSTAATVREGHSGHERKQQRQRHHYHHHDHRMGVLAMGVCAPGTLQTSASHASQLQSRTSRCVPELGAAAPACLFSVLLLLHQPLLLHQLHRRPNCHNTRHYTCSFLRAMAAAMPSFGSTLTAWNIDATCLLPFVMPPKRTPQTTRHTSHVTRHTSHVTRHTSHVTCHPRCQRPPRSALSAAARSNPRGRNHT